MISSSNTKLIKSLHLKKFREKHKLYTIEGVKLIRDYLRSNIKIEMLLAKPELVESLTEGEKKQIESIIIANDRELKQLSNLKTPNNGIAILKVPEEGFDLTDLSQKLCIMLDNIQDPGNLGTIIRVAAWFGIDNILCSPDSVDQYNPKVIQASMGAMLHVKVIPLPLQTILSEAARKKVPIYATTLNGESVYTSRLSDNGIILFGNESKGLSSELLKQVTHNLLIPSFHSPAAGIDSLNVGMSAAIICSEFRRRNN